MRLRLVFKRAIALPLCLGNKIGMALQGGPPGDFLILMYHRIVRRAESDTYIQDGMFVDPGTFRSQVLYLKKNFHVIPLEEIPGIGDGKNRPGTKKPFCALTFDDGWEDFYGNAFPVLQSVDVCATVFLPTDCIGTGKRFWTERLAHILTAIERHGKSALKNDRSSDSIVGKIERLEGPVDFRMENAVEALKTLPVEEIDRVLGELADSWRVGPATEGKSFLSWEEAREMYASGIVRFGSHTKSHRILSTASEELIREELAHSKEKLIEERVASPSFIPFSYPNGNYTQRIAELVREAGYHLAVTTEKGWNGVANGSNGRESLFRLRRIGIHQDVASTNAMFACRIHGIY